MIKTNKQSEINTRKKLTGQYLVSLIRCALNDAVPEEKPGEISWEQIYQLAQKNGVAGISYYSVKNLESCPPMLLKKWKSEKDMSFYRKLQFDEERSCILEEMEKLELSYLPLKGILISEYYPKPGMRSMADNDILYGIIEVSQQGSYQVKGGTEEEQKETTRIAQVKLVDFMKNRGYMVKNLHSVHDSYLKEPIFNFEMHRDLVSQASPHYEYYRNPWRRAIRNSENSYAYHFSDEDEYIYFLIHGFKHFDTGGSGIRSAIDMFVFLKNKGAGMDWDYIRKELKILGLIDFEYNLSRLAGSAFGNEHEMSLEEENMLYYMLDCGTYGNARTKVERLLEKETETGEIGVLRAKLQYIWNRLFLSSDKAKNVYPLFYKHKYLIPILPLYRFCNIAYRDPWRLLNEVRALWSTEKRKK